MSILLPSFMDHACVAWQGLQWMTSGFGHGPRWIGREGTYVILADDVLERTPSGFSGHDGRRRWERVVRSAGRLVRKYALPAGSHHIGEAIRTVGLQLGSAEDGWSDWGRSMRR